MLEFFFWDVQHGHAAYIKTPNNRHIAVDLGTGSFSTKHEFSPFLYLKNKYKVPRLDLVVITHPHRDHIDDIFNFYELNPKSIMRPKHLTEGEIRAGNKQGDFAKVDEFLKIHDHYRGVVKGTPQDARVPENWGGVKMDFFVSQNADRKNLNNHSVVTIFQYLTSKFILPGDNEDISWQELLKDPRFCESAKNADVLLAPHHGRKAGYSADLLDLVRPRLVVISDGPEGETSCTDLYAAKIRQYHKSGWKAYYSDNTWDERFCVTTRCDGLIRVRSYKDAQNIERLNVHLTDGTGQSRD